MDLPGALRTSLIDSPTFQRLANQVRAYAELPNLALPRAARLPVLAALQAALGVPILLITDRADRALTLLDECSLWAPDSPRLPFPEPTPLFYEQGPWSEATRRERIAVLTALAAYHIPGARKDVTPIEATAEELSRAEQRRQVWEGIRTGGPAGTEAHPVIVATARSLMARTLPRREFLMHTRHVRAGQRIPPTSLARNWVRMGYEAVETVVAPGQFARRGGILDVWPQAERLPLRVDFFGDEIEALRPFDPATQRTSGQRERVLITPAREYILPAAKGKEESSQPAEAADGDGPPGPESVYSEFHIPQLNFPASLLDYLPDSALILLDDTEAIEMITHEIESQALEMREAQIADGLLSADFPVPYTSWSELYDALTFKRYLLLGPATSLEKSDLARLYTPNPRFGGRIQALLDHLLHQSHRSDQSMVVSRQASRLQELWQESIRHRAEAPTPPPVFLAGSLSEGFLLSPPGQNRLHVIGDGEIFGWRRPQPRRRPQAVSTAPETVYADMQVGDWVVHIDHGIGRFMGLVNRRMESIEREYLAVEYDDGDQLYVPVHQADRLTRYVGPEGRAPRATRLGTGNWKKQRERVQEAVQEVAQDLLELYARRLTVSGFAFSEDSEWQRELEASFPYIETEDQERVIAEVKRDMQSDRPMDRLICGDVGYGKTEVALRAAFKAVFDGKQVAMLVPTTILAQQHYHTFRDRLAPFPVEVEMLSRFRTDREQRDILFRLAAGAVDIIIGTHRLLSDDVVIDNLGLLIIDEEQRFGVSHKEKLKRMRTEVDVLTMTATPIPRTLYMALSGVRDISTIDTPPDERLPIITHVGPYAPRLVRQAILRELERGGQVFFVHNRVQTIMGMKAHLERLVPEARISVGHGQMPEAVLSRRMQHFTAGEIDVLLSTSIIESGLDIPNANTLIVDRADTFGLAQLYQLRGRVGRGTHQAYAYFLKHRKKPPTLEGRERLETLAEHTQLGAGYAIAMRDLEIRGAGDLLGTRQHGHIAAVGFHLYTRLLAQAVQQARGDRRDGESLPLADLAAVHAIQSPVNVELAIPAGLPPDYIRDRDTRLRLYRRLADIRDPDQIDRLKAEFRDRFGEPPAEVDDLFYQIRVKLLAQEAGLISIGPENGQLVLRFPAPAEGEGPRLPPDLGTDTRQGKDTIRLLLKQVSGDWRSRLLEILESVKNFPA